MENVKVVFDKKENENKTNIGIARDYLKIKNKKKFKSIKSNFFLKKMKKK